MKRKPIIVILGLIAIIVAVNVFYFTNQTVTLNFYSHPDKNGAIRESILKFEAENPKIRVNLVELPDNTNEKYELISSKLALKDGSVDIIDSDVTWPAIFVSSDWIEPLDKYFSKDELSQHFQSSIEAAKINNKLYGIPYRYDSGLIFYRKDLLDKYGFKVPQTFNELMAISKSITANEKDLYGFAGSWKNFEGLTCNFIELLWANSSDLNVNENGSVSIDQKEVYDTIKLMTDLIYKHKITPEASTDYSSGDVRTLFAEGKLIFMRDWPAGWAVINAPDSKVRTLVGVMPIPKLNETGSSPGTYGGWQYMLSKHSKHKSASVKFIKFMTSTEEQKKTFLTYSYLPSKSELYYDPEIQEKIPFALSMADYFNTAKTRPRVANYDDITFIIQNEVHKAISGEQSPESSVVNMNELLGNLKK